MPTSWHMYGIAVDIGMADYNNDGNANSADLEYIAKMAKNDEAAGYIQYYPTFVHIDWRNGW